MNIYPTPESFLRSTIETLVHPTEEEWEVFLSKLNERQVKKNEVYLKEGEYCKKVAFIVTGCFRMYYIVDGEERCKDFQVEGQFTGSAYSLYSGQPSRFYIAAVEDSLLLEMTRENLFELYDEYKVWERLGRKYMDINFINKEAREASLLLDSSASRYRNLLENQADLYRRIPQKFLASYLGIKPESLSRLRKQFALSKS